MKRSYTKFVATLLALATTVGASAASSFPACAAGTGNASVESVMSKDHTYTWSDVTTVVTLKEGFSLNLCKSITVSIDDCPGGAAVVKIYKFGSSQPVRSFTLPATPMPSQSISVSLSAGSYYLTVQPGDGYTRTSGSILIMNVDGVTDVN